jgi:uncharacterized protein (DUF433 family)
MNGRYSLNLPIDLKHEAEELADQQGVSLNQLILWSLAEKVSALKSKLDDPNFPGITFKLDSSNQPVPVIKGKGIRVQTVVVAHHNWNESIEDIAAQYELPQRSIKEALSFYDTHKTAIDSLIQSNDEISPVND